MGAVEVVDVNDFGAWDDPRGNYRMRLLVWLINPVTRKVIQLPNTGEKISSPDLEKIIVIFSEVPV